MRFVKFSPYGVLTRSIPTYYGYKPPEISVQEYNAAADECEAVNKTIGVDHIYPS